MKDWSVDYDQLMGLLSLSAKKQKISDLSSSFISPTKVFNCLKENILSSEQVKTLIEEYFDISIFKKSAFADIAYCFNVVSFVKIMEELLGTSYWSDLEKEQPYEYEHYKSFSDALSKFIGKGNK